MSSFSQVRRNVSTLWEPSTILLDGELGFETDTGQLKIGRAGIPWSSLEYVSSGGSGGTGGGLIGPRGPTGARGATGSARARRAPCGGRWRRKVW